MTNFIEQPATEINNFNIGDRVRVYHGWGTPSSDQETKVKKIESEYLHVDGNFKAVVHFKQCRLLKPVLAREWFVTTDVINSSYPANNIVCWTEVNDVAQAPEGAIRVREVLDEK